MTTRVAPDAKPRVLLVGESFTPLAEQLRAAVPSAEYVTVGDAKAGEAYLHETDAVIMGTKVRPAYVAATKVRWLHLTAAGIDAVAVPELRGAPFTITHKSLASAAPMADYVLAQILAFSRRVHDFRDLQRQRKWAGHDGPGDRVIELRGKTVGLVGLGAVGREIARRARPFGLRVVGVKRKPAERVPHVDRVLAPEQLNELLAVADFLAVVVPLTDATHHLIGESELRAMKRTAYLINVSRGAIIDEPALIRALREGWIAGAALDVFEHEPLPADNPLWDMPGVIVTPHYSGAGPAHRRDAVEEIVTNMRRFVAGRPLLYQVNRADISDGSLAVLDARQ